VFGRKKRRHDEAGDENGAENAHEATGDDAIAAVSASGESVQPTQVWDPEPAPAESFAAGVARSDQALPGFRPAAGSTDAGSAVPGFPASGSAVLGSSASGSAVPGSSASTPAIPEPRPSGSDVPESSAVPAGAGTAAHGSEPMLERGTAGHAPGSVDPVAASSAQRDAVASATREYSQGMPRVGGTDGRNGPRVFAPPHEPAIERLDVTQQVEAPASVSERPDGEDASTDANVRPAALAEAAPAVDGAAQSASGGATADSATSRVSRETANGQIDPAVPTGAAESPGSWDDQTVARPDGEVRDDDGLDHDTITPMTPRHELDPEESRRAALVESLPAVSDDTPLMAELKQDARRRIELRGRRFPRPPQTRVITVANQKGGVGKTPRR